MHHPFEPLESGCRYVACSLPVRYASLFSTASNPATGALLTIYHSLTFISFSTASKPVTGAFPALQLSLIRVSLFHCWLFGYWCVARSLPLCRVSLFPTISYSSTGVLPALFICNTLSPFPFLPTVATVGFCNPLQITIAK